MGSVNECPCAPEQVKELLSFIIVRKAPSWFEPRMSSKKMFLVKSEKSRKKQANSHQTKFYSMLLAFFFLQTLTSA